MTMMVVQHWGKTGEHAADDEEGDLRQWLQDELDRGEAIKQYLIYHKLRGTTFSKAVEMLMQWFPDQMARCQWHRLLALDDVNGGIRLQQLASLPQAEQACLENAFDLDTVEIVTDRLDCLGAVMFGMRGRQGYVVGVWALL